MAPRAARGLAACASRRIPHPTSCTSRASTFRTTSSAPSPAACLRLPSPPHSPALALLSRGIALTSPPRAPPCAPPATRLAARSLGTKPTRPAPSTTLGLRDFLPSAADLSGALDERLPPYLDPSLLRGDGRDVFVETYGCQMNVSDSEIVHAVLRGAGYGVADSAEGADVVLLNTCAIRDGAEQKIWARLRELRALALKQRRRRRELHAAPRLVGVLGCMGERLKGKLLEEDRLAHLVCGPDAYRSLPRLLAQAAAGQPALDVQLSQDETYADVAPVRESGDGLSAFVSIMRGCNNMCSYCIVPFTRGRERSRAMASIAAEVSALAADGYREVTLLGQNVNTYVDPQSEAAPPPELRDGFHAKVPPPRGSVRFAQLLARLADAHPEMRFRFTSPHPKDFPDELLREIAARPNLCNSLHIPAQSGSSAVLAAMRRGYSRETYLELTDRVRELLPRASISSDFISGFCGEREEDHEQTLSLLRHVRFDKAFMFAYSMREKTHAHRALQDDVPEPVKQRRLREVIDTFNMGAREANAREVGRYHLLLVDGLSKKSESEWAGRTDCNRRVVFARKPVARGLSVSEEIDVCPGDYVAVRVTECISANTLRAEPIARSSMSEFYSSPYAQQ